MPIYIIVGMIILSLLLNQKKEVLATIKGWKYILTGFFLIFFGMIIDITDNFENLNKYIIIGDTQYQAFLEKVIGYLLGFMSLAIGIWLWIPGMIELQNKRKKELNEAKQKVRILSGLLPICANCKKIRDDKGYWNQIELYIDDHSEAEFTHGICPECSKKLYPELHEDE